MNPSSLSRPVPPLWRRLGAVIYRHKVVYDRNWVTNSFGVILEPVMYFVAMAWGLASSIGDIDGLQSRTGRPGVSALRPRHFLRAARPGYLDLANAQ